MYSREQCKICDSDSNEVICNEIRGGIPCNVLKCLNCGLVFLPSSFLDQEKNETHYKEEYEYSPSLDVLQGTEYDPYWRRMKRIAKFLDPNKTTLFEIGSGSGRFIKEVKPHVKEIVGLELNEKQAEFCRNQHNVQIYNMPVEDVRLEEKFDIVCMFQVLEHVADPGAMLKKAMSFVKPNGLLYIDIPNLMDPILSLYMIPGYDKFYYRKSHLFNFNQFNLELLLKKCRFENFSVELEQNYSLSNHMYWAITGAPQSNLDVGYRFNFPVDIQGTEMLRGELQRLFDKIDREYREILSKYGYSDMISCIIHNK